MMVTLTRHTGNARKQSHMQFVKLCACVTRLLVCCALLGSTHAHTCNKTTSCSCVYDDGFGKVDLTPLAHTDGTPSFHDVIVAPGSNFSWNPCTPFSDGYNNSKCQDVAVCLKTPGLPKPLYHPLATHDSATFTVSEYGHLLLTYTDVDDKDFKTITIITLECWTDMDNIKHELVADDEPQISNNTSTYRLTLTSTFACAYGKPYKPIGPSTQKSSLKTVSIVMIVVFSLIAGYVVFGALYQVFVRKESGIRAIPNHRFWRRGYSCLKDKFKSKAVPLITENNPKYESL